MAPRPLPLVAALLAVIFTAGAAAQDRGSQSGIASSHPLRLGTATLQVDFAPGRLDLPVDTILAHIRTAASAIVAYYGRFPVEHARMLVIPDAGEHGVMHGTTWGNRSGAQAFTRIHIGEHTNAAELADDWMVTHEMVHMAFPSMPDDQHWMEEGQATYIEPVARVMTGELDARRIWHDMLRDMPKGEPAPGDRGLDHTHTWARTYWGGALFCLVADVAIRRETHNQKGLEDALRAVMAQGGTIDHDWTLPQALAAADGATGTQVLTRMYSAWKDEPVRIDLAQLWQQLGIRSGPEGGVEFIPSAPLASVREAITRRQPTPR